MNYRILLHISLLFIFGVMLIPNHMFAQDCTNEIKWNIDMVNGNQGDEVCVHLKVDDFKDIASFSFSINFDPSHLDYIKSDSVIGGLLMNDTMDSTGVIRVLFVSPGLCSNLPDGSTVMQLCFHLVGAERSQSTISLSGNDGIKIELLYGCGAETRLSDYVCVDGGEISIAGMTSPTQEANPNEYIVHVYPNPFTDYIELDFNNSYHEKLNIEVLDISGNSAASFTVDPNFETHRQRLPLIDKGLYLLRFQMNGLNIIKKLFVE